MKSLNVVRNYLEKRVPELLEVKNETYDSFFLQVTYLIDSNTYLQSILYTKQEEGENKLLYVKPLDTWLKYEYLENKLLGVYQVHQDISTPEPVYELRDDSPLTEEELIEYIKSLVEEIESKSEGEISNSTWENLLSELNKEMVDSVEVLNTLFIAFTDDWELEHITTQLPIQVVESPELPHNQATFYFKDLKSLITLRTHQSPESWDTSYGFSDWYSSVPSVHIKKTFSSYEALKYEL